jgi:NADH-quinone oxidoreductase subunit N
MKEFLLIMPEIFLALTLAFVIAGEITYYGEQVRLITATALLGLGGAFIQTIISYEHGASQIFGGVLSIDGFSLFFKLFFIVLAAFSIASVSHSKEIAAERRSEYCALVLASTLAMCLLASVADLALAFLSFLLLNVISHFLAAYGKRSILSTEAAVKSMAFGAMAAAMFLYSAAILFATTHSLNIYEIHKVLLASPLAPHAILVVFVLLLISMSYQIGSFPSYLVVPDILEGSPTPVSAFLSLGPRAAGFAFTTRVFVAIFTKPASTAGHWEVLGQFDWTQMMSVVSGLSMAVGSLLAFRQKSAKRLVSYLVVAETGFLLIGLLVLDEVGIAALLYSLVIQLFALVGIFYVLSFLIDQLQTDRLDQLRGAMKGAVPECICLVIFLLCLVGSPPTPGFIAKFSLIGAAIRHERFFLAIVAVASMVLSAAAVARLVYHLIGDFRDLKAYTSLGTKGGTSRRVLLAALLGPMVLAGVFAEFVFNWAGQSLGFIFW